MLSMLWGPSINSAPCTGKNFSKIIRWNEHDPRLYSGINDKNKTNFTHVISVKADKNLYGNLNIQLQNNLPSWIEKTGTENDCDIIDDVSHTFAFDQLMIGISKAYQKVNNNSQYLDINLKINF